MICDRAEPMRGGFDRLRDRFRRTRVGRRGRWKGCAAWLASLLTAAAPPPSPLPPVVPAPDPVAQFEALRAVDARLASVGYRLATANAALCRDLQPGTGAVLQTLDEYEPSLRPAAKAVFGFATPGSVSVELVVPRSPADRAGVRAGDGVFAINGDPLPASTTGAATVATRDAIAAQFAARPPAEPLRLTIGRGGATISVALAPVPECRVGFELLLGPRLIANSDGRQIQVGVAYLARFGDDQIAVIVAHELAHIILRHRARLEAAGVHWGLLGQLGRNARLFRETEDAADQLSVSLLRNAGYDPRLAVAFWRSDVGELDGGILHSATHGSAKERAAAIAAEIARLPADAPTPYRPPVLETRDQPLR